MATLHEKIMGVEYTTGTNNPELQFIPSALAEVIVSHQDVLQRVLDTDFDKEYRFLYGVSESGQVWIARTKKDEIKYQGFLDDIEDV